MPPSDSVPVADMPGFLRAYATADGELWVYRSVVVQDTDPVYLGLWTTAVNNGGTLVLADEFDDELMMFGKAKLEVWQL